MGQYYRPVNVDTSQSLCPWKLGTLAKLMEHSYLDDGLPATVMTLLASDWSGARIVWAGDYADVEVGKDANLYDLATLLLVPSSSSLLSPRFLINRDRREYIDLRQVSPQADGLTLHPLPLLTAEGNGRGGGDYHGCDHRIGLWAREHLAASDIAPTSYAIVDGTFIE